MQKSIRRIWKRETSGRRRREEKHDRVQIV
jgi:hypothetical protein